MTLNNQNQKPAAYKVKDDDNLDEKDLQRTFLFGKGDEEENGKARASEGLATGGERFGDNNDTPSGDDKNNPSQNAGHTNAYFNRTEPSEEHPEYNNFKDPNQLGQSNFAQVANAVKTGQSGEEDSGLQKGAEDKSGNKNESETSYQEGTADGSEENIPGPNELPDQQKVGE